MSPEQALGQRGLMDHRTDIYSLGVTLYELLTLEPVFNGSDRQELLRQIALEEPRPPRSLNWMMPVELETIVLKAIAKNPGDRYATAQDLATDLQSFIDDRPIRARRPTLVERAVKWARRHQAVVACAALLFAVVTAGSIVSTILIAQAEAKTRAAYERERVKAREAADQRRLAQESVGQARQALFFISLLGEEELARKPELQRMRNRVLQTSLDYHLDFIAKNAGNPAMAPELAISHTQVGTLLNERGLKIDALAQLESARELEASLVGQYPDVPVYQVRLEHVLRKLWALQGCRDLELLTYPAVAEELRLSQAQKARVAELPAHLAERKNELLHFARTDAETQAEKSTDSVEACEKEVAELLTAGQRERLRQINLQIQGPRALIDRDVNTALALTADQKKEIWDIYYGGRVAMFKYYRGEQDSGRPLRTPQEFARGDFDKILHVLSAEQKAKWQQLIGPHFAGDIRLGFPQGE
jgi:hypothetical protein